jgi:hypothetical protein
MSRKRPRPVPPRATAKTSAPIAALWIAAGLVVLTAVVFVALRHFDFIGFDDPGYVRDNTHVTGGLTWSGLQWAWTTGLAANWHPLTWMSHMLDVQLFGVNPGWHHVTSVVIHIVNVVLLFALLKRATGAIGPSAFTAALFAVHPLHVESVAWIAERKDVLSTMFWWLAMLAYVAYVQGPRWWKYAIVCLCMALGLLCKPMLVTLPVTLMLFDVWPLGRLAGGRQWIRLIV